MLEQVNTAIRFHGFFVASAVGATGLTVTVDVRRNGTLVVTGGSATEEGGGLYYYELVSGSVNAEGYYTAVFKTAGTADQKHVPSLVWVDKAGIENLDEPITSILSLVTSVIVTLSSISTAVANAAVDVWSFSTRNLTSFGSLVGDIADQVWNETASDHVSADSTGAKLASASTAAAGSDPLLNPVPGGYASGTAGHALGRIGATSITVTSAASEEGNIEIVRGDDYNNADGTALDFSSTTWPPLTGATITATFRTITDVVALTITGSVITATGTKVVRLELTAAQTESLNVGTFKHDIEATLTSGRKVTLVRGTTRVLEAQTR